jgi:uncharacterized protein
MLIKDRVYGNIEVTESVLLELINSKPVQRLRGIYNSPIVYSVSPWKDFTRYEHSLGAMLCLRIKGASVEEQIAGLLHDVPHTAFSHAVDFVFNDEKHAFHERFHEKIIKNSFIPKILEKHGFGVERVLDDKNFTLLEKDLPDLCADRIDYTLREFVCRDKNFDEVQEYIKHIVIHNKVFVFDEKTIAKKFSEKFLEMIQNWGGPEDLATQQIIVETLKIGLKENIIVQEDLFTTDQEVIDKLKASHNKEIEELFGLLSTDLKVINDPADFNYYAKEKNRFIDPLVLPENKKVSDIYPDYMEMLTKHKEFMNKGIYAKIIK